MIEAVKNIASGAATALNLTWGCHLAAGENCYSAAPPLSLQQVFQYGWRGDVSKTTELSPTARYYESSEGGCTKEPNGGKPQCSSQPSGAYMFRPAQQYTHACDNTLDAPWSGCALPLDRSILAD